MIRIAEIFHSVQGEGRLTGIPSVFIRTSGCNLRCWYCDTPYASWEPEGQAMSVHDIFERTLAYECPHIVITGGEPLIWSDIPELSHRLREEDCHVTIETAGTVIHEPPAECDLISISPKLSNSTPTPALAGSWHEKHETARHRPEVVKKLIASAVDYQIKFVVGSILDAEEVLECLPEYGDLAPDKVMLMPRGVTSEELKFQASWLAGWCTQHGFRYCDRAHIHWFGNQRGT